VAEIGRRIRVLIAEEKGKAIGYAIYLFTYSSFRARPNLYLEDLFVRPEARRRGAGKAFFRALRREAAREGCGRIEWMVLRWNEPAIRFYERLGAEPLDGWLIYRLPLGTR
jgi:GNAT superfamily N-acetyltransferase